MELPSVKKKIRFLLQANHVQISYRVKKSDLFDFTDHYKQSTSQIFYLRMMEKQIFPMTSSNTVTQKISEPSQKVMIALTETWECEPHTLLAH